MGTKPALSIGRFSYTLTCLKTILRAKILEAMCGSGQSTDYLLEKGATVTGLDISSEMVNLFKNRHPGSEAYCASILDNGTPSKTFDVVVIAGGLHHVHPHVNSAMIEIHRLLKPNGYFCFYEPHSGSLVDIVRKWWYKRDSYFEDNEASIDIDKLSQRHKTLFENKHTHYLGNIAYLFVLNSLIFRIPLRLKKIYSPFLFFIEHLLSYVVRGKKLTFMVTCKFRKLPESNS